MFAIDSPVRLSSSKVWALNAEFYENQGQRAWSDEIVPTRITSNPMIAAAYADVIAGYLRDVASKSVAAETVNIVELGTGSGQFSYLLIQALEAAVALIGAHAPVAPFRYIMSDVAESNLRAWRDNGKFTPFVERGVLDFALLNVDAPQLGHSVLSGRRLPELLGAAPSVVIANYVFDSLVCDAFRAEDGRLFEVKVGVESKRNVAKMTAGPEMFKAIEFSQTRSRAGDAYYGDPEWDDILAAYAKSLQSANFLFPVGALRFLAAMQQCSPAGFLLLAADKGRADVSDYEGRNSLGLIQTGAFSTMVNFDAIGRWVQGRGGQFKRPELPHDRFEIFAYVLGATGQGGETELAYRRALAAQGPHYHHWLVGAVLDAQPEMTPRALLALLEISHFDPEALIRMGAGYLGAIGRAERAERARLKWAIERCLANHFQSGAAHDPHFIAGKLFHELRDPVRALECFALAKGPRSLLAYSQALCLADLGESEAASSHLRLSLDARRQEAAA